MNLNSRFKFYSSALGLSNLVSELSNAYIPQTPSLQSLTFAKFPDVKFSIVVCKSALFLPIIIVFSESL